MVFKRHSLSVVLSVCVAVLAHGQRLSTMASLPDSLSENSGLEWLVDKELYLVEDGGNPNRLYRYNADNGSVKSVIIANAENVDWEDLTLDTHGFLYIGDFGNNSNNRKDLIIYKLNPKTNWNTPIEADSILFSFSNQKAFPPPSDQLNFDCEAMAWYNDSLYLFTKNRTSPFDGWCYMYVLPDKTGKHIARLVDSIQWSGASKEFGWITSADIRGDSLVLLSSSKIHLAHNFGSTSLEKLDWKTYHIAFSQKESICFGQKESLFVSDELQVIGNKLYLFELESDVEGVAEDIDSDLKVYHTLSSLKIKLSKRQNAKVAVFTMNGAKLGEMSFDSLLEITGNEYPSGIYLIHLQLGKQSYRLKWSKMK